MTPLEKYELKEQLSILGMTFALLVLFWGSFAAFFWICWHIIGKGG